MSKFSTVDQIYIGSVDTTRDSLLKSQRPLCNSGIRGLCRFMHSRTPEESTLWTRKIIGCTFKVEFSVLDMLTGEKRKRVEPQR